MADDAAPPAENPVSMEAPSEGSPELNASSGDRKEEPAVQLKAESDGSDGSPTREPVGSEGTTAPEEDKRTTEAPVTESAVAEAIAAATPRGEKSSSASEPKIELSATKDPEPALETKEVIKEEKAAPHEVLAPALEQKLHLKVEKTVSQPSSPSAADSILPTSPQIRAITGSDSALPVKEYLNSTIVPVLRDALRALVKTRPDDPYEFVAKYLVDHKPTK